MSASAPVETVLLFAAPGTEPAWPLPLYVPKGRSEKNFLFYLTYLTFFVIIAFAVGGQPPCAGVAQPVEQLICNQQVGGSNPSTSSTSTQALDRSLPCRHESSFPSLCLLSKSNPLRWTSVWGRPAGGAQLHLEEFPSGQRGQTVNLLRFASVVRIHPPPPAWSKDCFTPSFLFSGTFFHQLRAQRNRTYVPFPLYIIHLFYYLVNRFCRAFCAAKTEIRDFYHPGFQGRDPLTHTEKCLKTPQARRIQNPARLWRFLQPG